LDLNSNPTFKTNLDFELDLFRSGSESICKWIWIQNTGHGLSFCARKGTG